MAKQHRIRRGGPSLPAANPSKPVSPLQTPRLPRYHLHFRAEAWGTTNYLSALCITWPLSTELFSQVAPNTLLGLTFSLLVSTVGPGWDAGTTDWMLLDVTVLSLSSPLLRAVLRLVRGCFLSGLASTGVALRGFTGWGLQRQTGGELQGGKMAQR